APGAGGRRPGTSVRRAGTTRWRTSSTAPRWPRSAPTSSTRKPPRRPLLADPVPAEDRGDLVEVLVGGRRAALALGWDGRRLPAGHPGRRGGRGRRRAQSPGVLPIPLPLLLPAPRPAAPPPGDHQQDPSDPREQQWCAPGEDQAAPRLGGERQGAEEATDRHAEPPQHLEYADQVEGNREQRPGDPARRGARATAAQREPAADQADGGQPTTEKEPRDLAKGHGPLPSADSPQRSHLLHRRTRQPMPRPAVRPPEWCSRGSGRRRGAPAPVPPGAAAPYGIPPAPSSTGCGTGRRAAG